MYILKSFPGSFNLPSHSPYCVKVMGLLRLSGVTWQTEWISDPSDMPYGKLPVLEHQGKLIADSARIAAYLQAQGAQLYPDATSYDQAVGHAFICMAEGNLCLGLVHDRWLDPACWPKVKQAFFGHIPKPQQDKLATMLQTRKRQAMTENGVAKLTAEDRLALQQADLDSIEVVLGDKSHLVGAGLSAADAAVVPILAMIRALPAETALQQAVASRPTLVRYIEQAGPVLYGRANNTPKQRIY